MTFTPRPPAFSRVLYCVPTVDQDGNVINVNGNEAAVNTSVLSGQQSIAESPYTEAGNANGISSTQRHYPGMNSYITAEEFTSNTNGTSPNGGIDYGNETANRTNQRSFCHNIIGVDTNTNNQVIGVTVFAPH